MVCTKFKKLSSTHIHPSDGILVCSVALSVMLFVKGIGNSKAKSKHCFLGVETLSSELEGGPHIAQIPMSRQTRMQTVALQLYKRRSVLSVSSPKEFVSNAISSSACCVIVHFGGRMALSQLQLPFCTDSTV